MAELPDLLGVHDDSADGGKLGDVVDGVLVDEWWGSMGDWPMAALTTATGDRVEFTRYGDVRRYARGLTIRLTMSAWKQPAALLEGIAVGERAKALATRPFRTPTIIEIERSRRRASGVAPGPGGAGRRRLGGSGSVVHWLLFSTAAQADAATKALTGVCTNLVAREEQHASRASWTLRATGADEQVVRTVARDCEGLYDGSETLALGGPIVTDSDIS